MIRAPGRAWKLRANFRVIWPGMLVLSAMLTGGQAWSQSTNYAPPTQYYGVGSGVGYINESATGDFNGDGRTDVVVARSYYPLQNQGIPIQIYLNLPRGIIDGTSSVINGSVPTTVHPRGSVIADFNGDGKDDIFIADHGYDASPFPGAQNVLLLSRTDGKLEDKTATNLPQVVDFSHSATGGDIDGDGDIDIYVGNIWGQQQIGPYFLINDGSGNFTADDSMLPLSFRSLSEKFTSSLLKDMDFDGNLDLVLGPHDPNGPRQNVLMKGHGDGTFTYTRLGPIRSGYNDSVHIAVEDITRDGLPEILFSIVPPGYAHAGIQVYTGKADGSFVEVPESELAFFFTAYDFNASSWIKSTFTPRLNSGDCLPDVAFDLVAESPRFLISNLPDNPFVNPGIDTGWMTQTEILDVDGDGANDIFTANSTDATITRQITPPGCPIKLVSAVLPTSRSVQVGQTATIFGAMINLSTSVDATNCRVRMTAPIAGRFDYQTTDPAGNQLTGSPNTPVNIPPRGVQSFVLAFTPSEPMTGRELGFGFVCDNSDTAADIVRGVNTYSFSASTGPVPDIIAIAQTPAPNDGVVRIPTPGGNGVFAMAGINIGAPATLNVAPVIGNGLPVTASICQTDSMGACLSPPSASVAAPFATDQVRTFTVFLQDQGEAVAFDPGRNRIKVEFRNANGGELHGSTGLAVMTQ
ncbi:hypothetical protein CSC94_19355 [Zhengella mangrovi]|uniref:VCBS repeat-containing protein n=1 Tax=Zhengella mangrovi TaxID=1982044 RepID=A0A2G1QJ98_9HYPH|nr:VCBS repeat-containing protein [Zhengella mangrovi]PHP65288.1 hypothetical protein CSC94_19355 [Zhengella mangrovi]